jgi:glyceraldehyde 3-phosphate dehydrogenase
VAEVIPALKGKFDGLAIRVPTVDVSVVDLTLTTEKPVSVEAINEAMKKAANSYAKGYLHYCDLQLVSSDFIGHPASSIFDATLTKTMGDRFAKVFSWYDNEWGFSERMVDLVKLVATR